ncbi:MAG: hypothetical protein H6625_01265 [Bdellovibrionaceae bacterium]|nr:hypothetical protein [Pseudobdellovibrionaceae bacterium]
MANVIIIEDDDRTIREMSRYIRELAEDNNVRVFNTAEQFLKRYSGKNQVTDLIKNEYAIGFSFYTVEDLHSLKDLNYSQDTPFLGESAQLTLHTSSLIPKKLSLSEPSPLFGLEIADVIDNKSFFNLLIPEVFHKQWQVCQEKLKAKTDCSIILPIKNGSNLWLIYFVFSHSTNEEISVTIENVLRDEKGRGALTREINNRKENEAKELDMLSSIDLIILKNNLIEIDTREWVTATRNHLKENNYFPTEGSTRFVVIKYEDDKSAMSTLFHQYIDDLISLPLDRLVFLQKIDIVLNLPNLTKPRFLFLQPLKKEIELSKRTRLEKFNDLSIAISNPIALKPGLATTFFFSFPNDETPLRVVTKSAECEKHPTDPTIYVANFDYFGVDRKSQLRIKSYLRNINEYKEILSFDEDEFSYHPENIFLTEDQKRLKTVIVLDSDEQNRKQIKKSITDNMQQVRVVDDSTYYLFEKKYLLSEDEESIPLRDHEIYDKKIVWKVDASNHNFIEVVNEPKEGDLICGFPAVDFFDGPKEWKFLFEEIFNQELVMENLKALQSKEERQFLVDLRHADKTVRLSQLNLRHDINKIEMCIMPPPPDALQGDVLESIDAIVMEARMIPVEFDDWYSKFNQRIEQKRLNISNVNPKIISYTDPKEFT